MPGAQGGGQDIIHVWSDVAQNTAQCWPKLAQKGLKMIQIWLTVQRLLGQRYTPDFRVVDNYLFIARKGATGASLPQVATVQVFIGRGRGPGFYEEAGVITRASCNWRRKVNWVCLIFLPPAL